MAKRNEWDIFWKQAWRNLFHVVAMVAVVVVIVGVGVLVWGWVFPPLVDNERKAQRELFQKVVMQAPQPCAVKEQAAKAVNLKGCTLFRLRPGMSSAEVLSVINSSGYFEKRASLRDPIIDRKNIKDCKRYVVCRHYVSARNSAFYVSADFDENLIAQKITFVFEQDAHPYFDPKSLRAMFVKVIGPPDSSNGHDVWGEREVHGKLSIHAYTHNDTFWVVFETGQEKKESEATEAK
jgi:hypothetical protein